MDENTAVADGVRATGSQTATLSIEARSAVNGGDSLTVTFRLTNTSASASGYILDLNLPSGWRIVSRTDDGGIWNATENKWLWQTINPDMSVGPSITLQASSGLPDGSYEVFAEAKDADGIQDSVSQTISVPEPQLSRAWSFTVPSRIQYAVPAVTAQQVFVGSLDQTVYALDRTDGSISWQFDRQGSLSDSSPTISGSRVFIGGGGGAVYALSTDTGTLEWQTKTDSAIVSSPDVDSDTVYVGSNDGTVIALAKSDGTVRWRYTAESPIYSTIEVAHSTVYASTRQGNILALDAATGGREWRFSTASTIGHASPTEENGTLYVASDELYAIDTTDGTVRWSVAYGGSPGSTPTVSNDSVYVGGADGTLSAVNANDGSVSWSETTTGAIGVKPVVSGGITLITTDSGAVSLFDATTSYQYASISLDTRIRAATIDNTGRGYIGSEEGELISLPDICIK
ncbi:Pyrrolo-quinoline quinone [Halorhabdus utahensis DSM 12940]|uniref:Pyrrolo-quinoline quinone n=1 Tax=Halorhabdus utahensis (strain DSM 12940 / JCM 11049 / AX-2) TaxID=519442 RepID=C7NQ73_HALUD|nr:PQQ-binding-like beta-propeller repeat protein [Halorhabdus utahensis]ACV11817.1 Pyrrolo-quinoline quinone [Halorhabdus utahensis DSM 12940]